MVSVSKRSGIKGIADFAAFLVLFALGDQVNTVLVVENISFPSLKTFLLIMPILLAGLGSVLIYRAKTGWHQLFWFLGFMVLMVVVPIGTIMLIVSIFS